MSSVSRRTKWHPTPPPPPSPKILHFPRRRRTRRRKPHKNNPLLLITQNYLSLKPNLFDQEKIISPVERREREDCGGEKWRIQAETLLSGRKKIVEGESANAVLEEEIEDLAEKLDELNKKSRIEGSDVGSCSNFEQVADSSFSDCKSDNKSIDEAMPQENSKCSGRCKAVVLRIVEQVRAETEQWSQMQKMLEQVRGDMEELQISRDYWESRARNSDWQIQALRHAVEEWKEKALDYEREVHELENKVSLAKQKMHKSKIDLRAGESNVVPLGAQLVKERLALSSHSQKSHAKLCKHEKDLFLEENRIRTPRKELPPLSLAKQLAKEKRSLLGGLKENRRAIIQDEDSSKQELREDGRSRRYSNIYGAVDSNRSPLMEIGNSSPLARQKHRAAFDYHSPERSRIRESFRK